VAIKSLSLDRDAKRCRIGWMKKILFVWSIFLMSLNVFPGTNNSKSHVFTSKIINLTPKQKRNIGKSNIEYKKFQARIQKSIKKFKKNRHQ
jgi:hypothetical protein